MKSRQPVKVTAWLSSPLAGEPPMLDSVLESAMVRHMSSVLQSRGAARHAYPTNGGYRVVPIPIARDRLGDWLIPLASSPIIPRPAKEYAQRFARPMVTDSTLIRERRKINTSSGPNKSCLLPLRVRLVDRVVWYVVAEREGQTQCGVPEGELRKRLRKIGGVGSKVAHGYGVVERWDVDRVDDDWSWFTPSPDGPVLMRPLPLGDWLPSDMQGARPNFDRPCGPYFDKTYACEVVKPC